MWQSHEHAKGRQTDRQRYRQTGRDIDTEGDRQIDVQRGQTEMY